MSAPPAGGGGEWNQRLSKRLSHARGDGSGGESGSTRAASATGSTPHISGRDSDGWDVASVRESVIRCLHNPCYVAQGILFTLILSFIIFTMGLLFRWW